MIEFLNKTISNVVVWGEEPRRPLCPGGNRKLLHLQSAVAQDWGESTGANLRVEQSPVPYRGGNKEEKACANWHWRERLDRGGSSSYLAPVLDRGLVGDEEPGVIDPDAGAPKGTTVIGLGRGVECAEW